LIKIISEMEELYELSPPYSPTIIGAPAKRVLLKSYNMSDDSWRVTAYMESISKQFVPFFIFEKIKPSNRH